jgi:hypothetical protein
MAEILNDLSAAKVIEGIESNFAESVKYWGNLPHSLIEQDEEIIRMTTGVPVADLNFITSTGPVKGNINHKIEKALLFFESAGMPCLWWVFPGSASTDLTECLKAQGFLLRGSIACLGADLLKLNRETGLQQGLTIQQIQKQSELKMWAETSAAGLGLPDSFKDAYVKFVMTFAVSDISRQRLFMGFFDGEPVATSLLFLGGGISEINLVSTIPSKRKRGFGACITHHSLLNALETGYRIGALESLPAAENVYKSLGFREYGRVEIFEKAFI